MLKKKKNAGERGKRMQHQPILGNKIIGYVMKTKYKEPGLIFIFKNANYGLFEMITNLSVTEL